jgi:hypothetical protein
MWDARLLTLPSHPSPSSHFNAHAQASTRDIHKPTHDHLGSNLASYQKKKKKKGFLIGAITILEDLKYTTEACHYNFDIL